MGNTIKVDVQAGDVTSFAANVVAVKYAGGLFGTALDLAKALGKTQEDIQNLLPSVGSKQILPGERKIKAQKALFISVVSLATFDYIDVQQFAFDVLKGLVISAPETRHLALTLHGTGIGLDPSKVLQSELNGCLEAVEKGEYPPHLEKISIIERNKYLIERLKITLSEMLPRHEIETVTTSSNKLPVQSAQAERFSISPEGFDVFISYKSEDTEHAQKVYNFLQSQGLRVFFSEESLPHLGKDEYHEQIDIAIDKAHHMVVVTSSAENVGARWVEYEWRLFMKEKLGFGKEGNLITVIAGDMSIRQLPICLRNLEVIELIPGKVERLLEYVKRDVSSEMSDHTASAGPISINIEEGKEANSECFADPDRFVTISDFILSKTELLENASWNDAHEYSKSLFIDGQRGWRLPSIEQLGLIRKVSVFPDKYCYWSRKEAGNDEAFYVHFDDGHLGRGPKTFSNGLCAVFIKNIEKKS